MSDWPTVFSTLQQQSKARLRHALVTTVLALCGLLLLLGAAGFAVFALYDRLASGMASHLAALWVAGVLALIGVIVFAIARSRRRRSHPRPSTDPALETAVAEIERSPSITVLTALALGVVVGLLRGR